MRKKVLYLSYDGMTEPLGQSQVLPYLAGLSNTIEFTILSFEKTETFEKNKAEIQSYCDKYGINWMPKMYTKRPPVLSTLWDMRNMWVAAKQLHKNIHLDATHCRSYLPAIVGRKLQKRFNVPFLFDMRGFWADERIEGKIWNKNSPIFSRIYNYFKKKEKELLREADVVVSLTENGKSLLNELGQDSKIEEKTSVIPCCVQSALFDPNLIDSNAKLELKKKLNISENAFVLGYVGSIGTWYMLKEMLECFEVVARKNPAAIFLFVTREPAHTMYSQALDLGIDNRKLRIVSAQHSEVPLHMSIFDWSIFFIRPSFSKQASSPIKQAEIMAMGIPILTNSGIGDSDQIITESQAGYCFQALTKKNFEKFDFNQFSLDPQKIRQAALNRFDLVDGVKKYSDIYQQLWRK